MLGKKNTLLEEEITCINKMLEKLDKKIKKERGHESCAEEEDIVIRIKSLLTWYINKAAKAKNTYYTCSMLVIGIPLLVAVVNTIKAVSGPLEIWISVLITALSGLTSFMSSWLVMSRCQESWIRYRNCAEDIKDELDLYLNDVGSYTPDGEEEKSKKKSSSQVLSEHILDITQKERKQWTDMRKSKDEKN